MTTHGDDTTYHDWRPGDGLTCRYSRTAPVELPCGQPVKTAVRMVSRVGRADGLTRSPLCANHAPGGIQPNVITTKARRAALERLCAKHWKEYQKYYKEAIAELSVNTSQP